jgi:GT2 family glycosyltransferase
MDQTANPDAEPAGPIDCSILVPVLNEERYIEETVAAMREQQFDGRLEFVFADGGSHDRTLEILERLAAEDPRIRVLHNPGRTVSSGLNVALGRARGHWVARMDGHTRYPADYVALGVVRLARGDTRWVSGPPVPVGDNRISRAVALALRTPLGRGGSRKWAHEADGDRGEFELDSGVFAGVWDRSTLLEYDGWDERWESNEDSELAGRFLARGERLLCLPAMAASYAPRHTLGGLWRQYHRYGRERAHTASRHPHTVRPSQILPPALVLAAVIAVLGPRRLRRLARLGLGGYAGALAWAAAAAMRDDPVGDALLVPVVLATMHVAHGSGTLRWFASNPPPPSTVGRFARAPSPARADRAGPDEQVFNPSLRG